VWGQGPQPHAEKDEDGIPETVGDEPVMATDDLRDAVLKGADQWEHAAGTDEQHPAIG
jgi:hypothetical protein